MPSAEAWAIAFVVGGLIGLAGWWCYRRDQAEAQRYFVGMDFARPESMVSIVIRVDALIRVLKFEADEFAKMGATSLELSASIKDFSAAWFETFFASEDYGPSPVARWHRQIALRKAQQEWERDWYANTPEAAFRRLFTRGL